MNLLVDSADMGFYAETSTTTEGPFQEFGPSQDSWFTACPIPGSFLQVRVKDASSLYSYKSQRDMKVRADFASVCISRGLCLISSVCQHSFSFQQFIIAD